MKVTITVDIDPQAWADEYGIDRAAVREDVRAYVRSALAAHTADLGFPEHDTPTPQQGLPTPRPE